MKQAVKNIPKRKIESVKEISDLMKSKKTILIADISGIPGSQFQSISKKLRGKAIVKVPKRNLLYRAIELSGKKEILNLKEKISKTNLNSYDINDIKNKINRMDDIEKRLNDVELEAKTLQGINSEDANKISKLNEKINSLNELKKDFDNIKKRIDLLNAEEIKKQIENLGKQLDKLESLKEGKDIEKRKVKELTEKIENLSKQLNKFEFLNERKTKELTEKIVFDNLKKFAKVVDEKFPELLTKKDISKIDAKIKMLFTEIESVRRKIDSEIYGKKPEYNKESEYNKNFGHQFTKIDKSSNKLIKKEPKEPIIIE